MNQPLMPSLRRVNVTYTLIHLAYWALFAAFVGYQTALLLSRGFTSGQAGVFASLRCLSGIIAQPLLGRWADRHPHIPLKWIFNGSLLISLVFSILFYTTPMKFAGTAIIFLVLGALELSSYPLIDSMAVQYMNAGMDIKYSFGRGLGSMSYAVACVFLGMQAERFGVESILLTHSILIVVVIAVVFLFPTFPKESTGTESKEAPHSAWYLLRQNPSFALMLVASFFSMCAVLPAIGFLINIIREQGGDTASLGIALFLMASSEFPAAFLFQKLWRRFGSTKMMLISFTFMAVKPLLFLIAPTLFVVLAVQPIQMLGYGLFTPASVYFANENVPQTDRVQGQSLMMMASNGLGGVLGNLFAGYIIDWGGVNAMLLFSFICGIVGVGLGILAGTLSRTKSTYGRIS